jgi:hypothetical protein
MGRAIPRMGSGLGLSQWSSTQKQLHDPDELFRLLAERQVTLGFEHAKSEPGIRAWGSNAVDAVTSKSNRPSARKNRKRKLACLCRQIDFAYVLQRRFSHRKNACHSPKVCNC